jgi:hypothetical protein
MQGRYQDANLILVTHGLTLRIFLMRWWVVNKAALQVASNGTGLSGTYKAKTNASIMREALRRVSPSNEPLCCVVLHLLVQVPLVSGLGGLQGSVCISPWHSG